MLEMLLLHTQTMNLADIDGAGDDTYEVPIEFAGILKEYILMIEVISNATAAANPDFFIVSHMLTDNDHQVDWLIGDISDPATETLSPLDMFEALHASSNAELAGFIKTLPDGVTPNFDVLQSSAGSWAMSHNILSKKFKSGDTLHINFHASHHTATGVTFTGGAIEVYFLGRYFAFCDR